LLLNNMLANNPVKTFQVFYLTAVYHPESLFWLSDIIYTEQGKDGKTVKLTWGDEHYTTSESIQNEEDVILYWSEEFRKLTNWIESFKDEIGYMDEEFNVFFKHDGRKVVWTMLNDDIHKTFAPTYETNKKTGKKTITGTVDILRIGVTDMDCYYPDRELLDKERKRLFTQNGKEKPKEHREWVHIIYTPMGNKR